MVHPLGTPQMSEESARNPKEKAIIPIEEQTVGFYDDEIPVAIIEGGEVFVPLRPICDFLGVNYRSQRRRIDRDPVLSKYTASITIDTPGGPQATPCISLDYLNGWLFGISAASVKEEIRDRVVLYQEKCYLVLREAFQAPQPSETMSTLVQVREMGRAIMQMAQEQIEFERRLTTTEGRVEKAAVVYGDLTKRVETLEQRMGPGQPVTEDQASQISQAVKTVAMTLSKVSGSNQYGAVYGELYRKFGITSYKLLPAQRFNEAMEFLTEWNNELIGNEPF
jgi:hypothetical protein